MTTAAQRWSEQLAAWAIPDEILDRAPESPWIHPVRMFTVTGDEPDSPSRRCALAPLPDGGAVLDVGSGGGRASLALVPPAGRLVAVDRSEQMLAAYAEAAEARGVAHEEHLGMWPAVEDDVPVVDVVVCHHVAYDVADLAGFALALDRHARRRVVLELPARHPLANLAPYWKRFWDLERPDGPTADDAVAVLREAGVPAEVEVWDDAWSARRSLTAEEHARFTRIRLCLPEDREPEVADALAAAPAPGPRRTATVWWDC
ncbi:MAG TPA: methyltransferase domain-containing protein [Candidatus Nanopelagicales bacterium]|nr:methyltransferase domain-containing protein [Candidatus Nanopelagicales bacterium]